MASERQSEDVLGLLPLVGHGVRAGLVVGALAFLGEALYLLGVNGAFLALQMTPAATLARYAACGAVAGLLAALFSAAARRLLRRVDPRSLTTAVLLAAALLAEAGFYLFDIARPWGELSPDGKRRLFALLLGADLAVLALAYALARRFPWRGRPRGARFAAAYLGACLLLVLTVSGVPRIGEDGGPGAGGREGRPDVILIVLDTVRAEALSCYGNPLGTTPNLDRIAAEGRRFEDAIAPSTWTPPSHASLFTGLYPSAHGTRGLNTVLGDGIGVLSEWLREAGYASLTLYNNPLAGRLNRMDRGFDRSIGVETDRKVSFLDGRIRSKYIEHDTGVVRTTRLLRAWVTYNRLRDRPYFLFVNLNDAHLPYEPRQPWFEEYRQALVPAGATVDGGAVDRANRESGVIEFREGRFRIGAAEFAALRAAYYSEVSAIDRHLGGALLALREEGLLDNTLVIVTSDHGEALGEGGHLGHANGLYDEVIRIPLILWWPGEIPPGVVHGWVSLVDVAPTLLDLLRIGRDDVPRTLQGRNLLGGRGDAFVVSEHTSLDTLRVDEFILLKDRVQMTVDPGGRERVTAVADRVGRPPGGVASSGETVPRLRGLFRSWREECRAFEAARSPGEAGGEIAEDIRTRLRSLGYIE
jgi:arylsulfatase A-like enzyme